MALIFATRHSALARWQTNWVMSALRLVHPNLECAECIVSTEGDRMPDQPLPAWKDKAVFTQELESALLDGRARIAVHSLKDLPSEDTTGLTLAALPPRLDAREVVISRHALNLASLPAGAVIGTSSLRRAAQVLGMRPDFSIAALRGNVETRVRKALAGDYDAVLMAAAGLLRLGLEAHITEWLSLDVMLPAPGQGALAVQCRLEDQEMISLLSSLDHASTRRAVTAERSFVRLLGGGCSLPIAAYAEEDATGSLRMRAIVISEDGSRSVNVEGQGVEPVELADRLARFAIDRGALEILKPASASGSPS